MRNTSYLACALGCWGLVIVPMACSSKSGGVEGESTGGAGSYVNTGGDTSAGVGGNYTHNTSTGNGTQSGGTHSLDTQCAQQEVPIEPATPDILIVMDRSLSMTWDVAGDTCGSTSPLGTGECGTDSRWYLTTVAVQEVVQSTQDKVNWGMFYLGNEATQCGVSTAPDVPITQGESYPLIEQSLAAIQFTGQPGTPTATAIKNAAAYLRTVPGDNPKYLLLATDGEPNCAGGFNLMQTDAEGTASAITNARNAGYDTFVVGIATDGTATDATEALNMAAQAGGHPQTGASTEYYAVANTESLKQALTEIVGIATSCVISLANTPQGEWTIAISATNPAGETVEIKSDAENGWAYSDTSRSSITLLGSACEGLKNGEFSNFSFIYTCKGSDIVW